MGYAGEMGRWVMVWALAAAGASCAIDITDREAEDHLDCSSGECLCEVGWLSCGGSIDEVGCTTNIYADDDNCGVCGRVCPNPGCEMGECPCPDGWADCDGDDLCETNLATDDEHCGSCGQVCDNSTCTDHRCICDEAAEDCDGDLTNSCEVLVTTDREHCGACGRSCEGGPCEDRVCQAVEFVDDLFLADFVVVGNDVFGVTGCGGQTSAVVHVDSAGAVENLVVVPGPAFFCPLAVTADELFVYWLNLDASSGEMMLGSYERASAVKTFNIRSLGQHAVWNIAVDDNKLYWADRQANDVFAAPLNDLGTTAPLWYDGPGTSEHPLDGPTSLVVEGGYVFYHAYEMGGPGTTFKLDILDLTFVDSFSHPQTNLTVNNFAVHGDNIYLTTRTTVAVGSVERVNHTASPATFDNIAQGVNLEAVDADGDDIYFVSGGQLKQMPVGNGDPVTVAPSARATVIVTDRSVHWLDAEFGLWKLIR